MKSIIQERKECYVCYGESNLQKHHVLHGIANRKKADEDGCWCYLCSYHHTGSNIAVHGKYGKKLDLELKQLAQKRWCEYYDKTTEEFIERYGRSYL